MKKILLLAVVLCATFSIKAQSLFDNENNSTYFGARVGLDISSSSQSSNIYNNRAGFHFGAIYHIPVYMNLYFEPGLSMFYDTFGIDDQRPECMFNGYLDNLGFRVPFNIGFHFDITDDISVSVFTGPQFNYSFMAKFHTKRIHSEFIPTTPLPEGSAFGHDGFKHFDVQWNFGVGVSYKKYYLSVSGAPGITKVFDDDEFSFRRNLFQLTLGYNF